MKIREDLKDWQIARSMFGKNTQAECKIVKKLRKKSISLVEDCGAGVFLVSVEGEESGWVMFEDFVEL